MFGWLKNLTGKINNLSGSVDSYKEDSIIQSIPTVAYVNKAKKLIDEKKYKEAEIILKKALDISTQDSLVYKYLGKIYEIDGNFKDAADNYHTSSMINPRDKEIWLRLGMCRLFLNFPDEAIKCFERADKISPFNTDIKTGWGMALMKQNKCALARDKFMEATKISKYNFTAILLSAIMEIKLCDYDSAETKLAFLTKTAPNESSTYEYANLKLLKSDYKAAEFYAKKTIEINKNMLPAYLILAEVYSIQGKLDETEKIFNDALVRDLESARLHYEWGKAYLRFFDFEKAAEHFKIALEKENEYTDAELAYALICAMNGDFELTDKNKERNGNNVFIQQAIGLEFASAGKLEDAVEMFKKALRTDEQQTYNLLQLARTYSKLDNKDKTREYFEKFITTNPNYSIGLLEYSKWLINISDFADAQRKLRKIQKLEPENLKVLNLLFFTSYTLVKENICEYNVKEAISLAQKIQNLGNFDYEKEKAELENILINIQGNN